MATDTIFRDSQAPQLEQGLRLMESIIGGRWNPMILFALEQGASRFTELKNGIAFISDTELQRKLAALTESGLVTRGGPEEDARKGEYLLTHFGAEITHTLRHILDIQHKHSALSGGAGKEPR